MDSAGNPGDSGRPRSTGILGRLRRAALGNARFLCILGAFALATQTPGALAGPEVASEYQLKAVFLLNFTRFVEWPAQALAAPGEPFVIGILGDDPFGGRLDEAIRNERVGDHPLIVRRYRRPDEAQGCQLLFVDRAASGALREIVAGLAHRPVLTVSEIDGSAEKGVTVQFVTEDSRIRLRINAGAARTAGLVISSKLLHLADIVSTRAGD